VLPNADSNDEAGSTEQKRRDREQIHPNNSKQKCPNANQNSPYEGEKDQRANITDFDHPESPT
jgi:hypothetical protein